MSEACELRQSEYLNNLIERVHCFSKRLVKLEIAFFSYETRSGRYWEMQP
jgi:transposase-like protein